MAIQYGAYALCVLNTHSEYVILMAVALRQCLQESVSTLRHTHIASVVSIDINKQNKRESW
jgi:hypothetical protein